MSTGRINNKSQHTAVRIPLEIVAEMENYKESNESTSQFIIAAIQTEIKRRKRKQPK